MKSDYLFPQEADDLIAALPLEYRTIVLAAAETGFRIGDLCRAPSWAYDPAEQTIFLQEQKTGKYRTAAVTPRLRHALVGAADERLDKLLCQKWLFERERDTNMSRSTVWRWVTRTWARLHPGEGRTITPHSFRKLYAVTKRESGCSLGSIQKDLNHDRVETTMVYAFADMLHQAEHDGERGTYTVAV